MSSSQCGALISKLLFALTIGGAVLTILLRTPSSDPLDHGNGSRSKPLTAPRRMEMPNAFHLGVTIIFPNAEDKEAFLELFKPMAKYVEDFELGTLSYQLLQSDKDPLKVHVLERYKDKDYFLNVHRNSPQFIAFRVALQKLYEKGAKAEGDSFIVTDVGFI